MADLAALQQTLGILFKDLSLLEQALTHTSYVNENPGLAPASNERLEFLGDAVLGLVIAERLYQDLPGSDEGALTRLRAHLVSRETLAGAAKTISLGNCLYLGKGEEASNGKRKPVNLSAGLEAVIAAVFLDQGLGAARDVVLRLFQTDLERAVSEGTVADYKSQLQELLQKAGRPVPCYQIVEASGPAHDRRFTVEVETGGVVLGAGSGKSKKAAETEAARAALKCLPAHFTQ